MFGNFFSENRDVYEIMWDNIVEPGRPQMTVWCKNFACWIPKATDTHSEYVTLIGFSTTTMVMWTCLNVTFMCIILVGNHLDAQLLLWYVYLNPLHVSSNCVLILRRTIVLTLRRLMSYIYIYIYIYGAPFLDVSRSHTTTQHIR